MTTSTRFMLCSAPAIGGEPVRIELEEGEGKAEAEAKFRKLVRGLKADVLVVDPEEKPVLSDNAEDNQELLAALEKVDELQAKLNDAGRANDALTAELKTTTEQLEEAKTAPTSDDEEIKL